MDAMKRGTLAAPNEWTPRPFAPDDAFIQQCCLIATIRRRRFSARCECATWAGPESPQLSSTRPIDLDVEVADLLAQGIAVDAEEIGGADLVAARRGQRGGE